MKNNDIEYEFILSSGDYRNKFISYGRELINIINRKQKIIDTLKERNKTISSMLINNYLELDKKDVYIKWLECEVERLKQNKE